MERDFAQAHKYAIQNYLAKPYTKLFAYNIAVDNFHKTTSGIV